MFSFKYKNECKIINLSKTAESSIQTSNQSGDNSIPYLSVHKINLHIEVTYKNEREYGNEQYVTTYQNNRWPECNDNA